MHKQPVLRFDPATGHFIEPRGSRARIPTTWADEPDLFRASALGAITERERKMLSTTLRRGDDGLFIAGLSSLERTYMCRALLREFLEQHRDAASRAIVLTSDAEGYRHLPLGGDVTEFGIDELTAIGQLLETALHRPEQASKMLCVIDLAFDITGDARVRTFVDLARAHGVTWVFAEQNPRGDEEFRQNASLWLTMVPRVQIETRRREARD